MSSRAISICSQQIYLTEQVKKLQHNGPTEHEITIVWVPRRTLVSNKILEDEGVLGDVNVTEFPLSFLALEDDVLSLELEDSFQELFLVSLGWQCYDLLANL